MPDCAWAPALRSHIGGKKLRLLLIEDEARIVQLLTGALSRTSFAVDAVRTCAEGHALSSVPYDAAILDLGLPDGDGIALLSATRASGTGFATTTGPTTTSAP